MRIAFAGSPPAAVEPLRALHASGHEVALVVSQPDRPRGRRRTPTPTAVADEALALGLPLLRPESINSPEALAALDDAGAQALAVVAFGQILREGVLSRRPCVNVHFSLLPAYRGAAPVERAIMDGVDETGVTIMLMDAGLDTGPTLAEARTPVDDDDTGGSVTERLSRMGAELLVDALTGLQEGAISPRPQPEAGASVAPKIAPEDRPVDPTRPARAVARHIQALSPHIGATAPIGGATLTLWAARAVDEPAPEPVQSVDGRLILGCADGAVEVLEVQPPGRARMDARAFLRGHRGPLAWGDADG